MNNQTTSKKYLVTFADKTINVAQANAILTPATPMRDGLTALGTLAGQGGISQKPTSSIPPFLGPVHYSNLGISSLELRPDEAIAIAGRKGVIAVEEDIEMHALGTITDTKTAPPMERETALNATLLWNMSLIKAPAAWGRGINGTGISLAILDTGIAAHPDLTIVGGISCVPGSPSYNDVHGHGTHCAGIAAGLGIVAPNGANIYGVAPKCSLYAVKVLSDQGSGSSSWIIAGLSWCLQNGIKVASMSLGGLSAPYVAYATAIQQCQNGGVTVVCAAGNSFANPSFPWVNSPANSFVVGQSNESPLAIGAIDQSSQIASFSSRGGQNANWNPVTVVAPGVSIYSTSLNSGYKIMSGTSMACPHTAGFAALVYQRYPGISPQLVAAKISATAKNLGAPPFPNIPDGYGLIDCDSATR